MSSVFPTSDLPSADGVWHHLHLAPEALGADMPALHDAAIVVDQGVIVWIGAYLALPDIYQSWPQHDGHDAMVTSGLIDCHTHLVYGGQRANEFAMRLAGASYEEVARAGGGIVSSVKATRACSEDELFEAAVPRLQALLMEGVCAIEIKSGYGLSLEHERKTAAMAIRSSILDSARADGPFRKDGKSQRYETVMLSQFVDVDGKPTLEASSVADDEAASNDLWKELEAAIHEAQRGEHLHDEFHRIAFLRLQGHTHQEIGEQIGLTESRIAAIWKDGAEWMRTTTARLLGRPEVEQMEFHKTVNTGARSSKAISRAS